MSGKIFDELDDVKYDLASGVMLEEPEIEGDVDYAKFFEAGRAAEAIEEAIQEEVTDSRFANLNAKDLSRIVQEALAEITFKDDGRPEGSLGSQAPHGRPISSGTELPDH